MLNISNNFFGYISTRKNTPCIFVVSSDNKDATITIMRKLHKHGLSIYPVIITDCQDEVSQKFFLEFTGGNSKQIFSVKRSGPALSALQLIIPLQRLAYDTTIALGYDPDRPRNLAKELTT